MIRVIPTSRGHIPVFPWSREECGVVLDEPPLLDTPSLNYREVRSVLDTLGRLLPTLGPLDETTCRLRRYLSKIIARSQILAEDEAINLLWHYRRMLLAQGYREVT